MKGSTRRIFVSLFFKIFLLAVVVMLIMGISLVVVYDSSQKRWQKSAYDGFVDLLQKKIEDSHFSDSGFVDLQEIILSVKDGRISGCVMRSLDGNDIITVGKTPEGLDILHPNPGDSTTLKTPKYATRVTLVKGTPFITTTRESIKTESIKLPVPASVKKSDIIGTVVIAFEGTDAFCIDLLSYNPRTYEYSKDIINSCLRSFGVTIPVCLILSFLFALVTSRKNAARIDSIRAAIGDLARGVRDIEIDSKGKYLKEIATSIEDLDKALQNAEKSKTVWLNGLSHELNTPASGMKIIIEGITSGAFEADEENIKLLEQECDELIRKIKTVMEITSSEDRLNQAIRTENPSDLFI